MIKFKGRKETEECMNPKCPSKEQEVEEEERECPKCKKGTMKLRSSMYGKFYGCSNYPKCSFTSWDKPVAERCPSCGSPFMVEKVSKKKGEFLKCPKCKEEFPPPSS